MTDSGEFQKSAASARLDPFIGAGTTAIAAEQLGRDWLGIELNPDFAALAERRIAQVRGSPKAAT